MVASVLVGKLPHYWELGLGGPLGDIDPLNKVPFKRATSRVKKGPPFRGLPNTT